MGPNLQATPGDYLPLLILILLAAFIAGVLVVLSWILGPKRPTLEKLSPYECGVNPIGSARDRFPVKFYLVAMLFILFDIETIFLYPWAVLFRNNGMISRGFLLGEMAVFIVILFVGYIYVWKKGALDWE
ncbi:MAG TPA: NADH-quinone oxidoreductase subunit A [Capsulimonadaceae bacterium]|jgi:NADH-quinone oxidoreductase subunit A